MTLAPGRTDKVAVAAERSGPVTGGSASPAAKTRTSGDWRVTREKDFECTVSMTPFRYNKHAMNNNNYAIVNFDVGICFFFFF